MIGLHKDGQPVVLTVDGVAQQLSTVDGVITMPVPITKGGYVAVSYQATFDQAELTARDARGGDMSTVTEGVELNRTVLVGATLENADQGVVKLDFPVQSSAGFKAVALTKYQVGQRLELQLRISGTQKRTLIGHTVLNPDDRWHVDLAGVDDDGSNTGVEGKILAGMLRHTGQLLGWDEAVTEESVTAQIDALDHGRLPLPVAVGMRYESAVKLVTELEKAFPKAVVHKVKHTPEDMPHSIEESDTRQVEWIGDFWVPPDLRLVIPLMGQVLADGGHLNVMFTGDSGFGKTTAAQALADYFGVPLVHVNAGTVQDTNEWFGTPEAQDGSTYFNFTEFSQRVMAGNCLVRVDEINRAESWVHNGLMSLLDDTRKVTIRGHDITVGPGVIFLATKNMGLQYVGTFETDAALDNRFALQVEFGQPSVDEEVQIIRRAFPAAATPGVHELVKFMRKLRTVVAEKHLLVDVTTRSTKNIAMLLMGGMMFADAVRLSVVNKAQPSQRKPLLDVLAAHRGVEVDLRGMGTKP